MADVWGLMPKSQTDDETIEEAIARLIGEHEADESAHLGEGESLQSHKASEIIDHAARSIVFDKMSASQLIYQTHFENPDSFGFDSSPVFNFPGFNLHPGTGGWTSRKELWVNCEGSGLRFDFEKDMIFQFSLFGGCSSGGNFRFFIANGPRTNDEINFGLSINDGVARFFFAKPDGSNITYLNWPGWADDEFFMIRFEYVASAGKVYIYINDVLLGNIACPDTTYSEVLYIDFQSWAESAGQADFNISVLNFQLEP